jgi:hypothetical protein
LENKEEEVVDTVGGLYGHYSPNDDFLYSYDGDAKQEDPDAEFEGDVG